MKDQEYLKRRAPKHRNFRDPRRVEGPGLLGEEPMKVPHGVTRRHDPTALPKPPSVGK